MDHKEICAKALRCRGLQWWRWRQLHWKEVEKDKWSGPHPQRFNIYRWEDMVAGGSVQIHRKCRTVCRNLSRTTRVGCILLKAVEAGNSFRHVERAVYRWSRVPRGPMCVRHDWDGCRCCLVHKEKKRERKVWSALGTPLSVSSQS